MEEDNVLVEISVALVVIPSVLHLRGIAYVYGSFLIVFQAYGRLTLCTTVNSVITAVFVANKIVAVLDFLGACPLLRWL